MMDLDKDLSGTVQFEVENLAAQDAGFDGIMTRDSVNLSTLRATG
jgi:hypothetical protein